MLETLAPPPFVIDLMTKLADITKISQHLVISGRLEGVRCNERVFTNRERGEVKGLGTHVLVERNIPQERTLYTSKSLHTYYTHMDFKITNKCRCF